VRANNFRALRFVLNKIVYFRNSTIEYGNFVAVIVHIENEILAHNGKADQAYVAAFVLHNGSLL